MKPDIKEPPTFRGDHTDKCTVYEWIDLMTAYLRKRQVETEQCYGEIMERLAGKAKEIVKVSVRNSPYNLEHNPDAMFNVLKQHFGEAISSSTPLFDFYATLPSTGESAFDYWLQLNETMEHVVDCLHRRGRSVDEPGLEVSMQFIRHCPDEHLATFFRSKPLEKRSVMEVQDMLESRQRELRIPQYCMSQPECTVNTQSHVVPKPSPRCVEPTQPLVSQPVPLSSNPDATSLSYLIDMLSKLLHDQHAQSNRPSPPFNPPFQSQRPRYMCHVCNNGSHSTKTHCVRDHLCFSCFSRDHTIKDCPRRQHSASPSPAHASATQTEN